MSIKKIFAVTALLVLFVTGCLTSFPLWQDKQVSALSGEQFRWIDYNTIEVSGGELQGTTQFKLVPGTNPERFGSTQRPRHSAGCDLDLRITLTNGTARLTAALPNGDGDPAIRPEGAVFCEDMKEECTLGVFNCRFVPRFPGVSEGYNNQTITISGTRPGSGNQSEDDIDRGVGVSINGPNPANASPATITVQIKNASGTVVQTATPAQEPALGSDDPNNPNFVEAEFRPVKYFHSFLLDPGKYTVCATIVIPDCRPFEKKKFEPLFLEFGETSNERSVIAKITVKYTGGPQNMTVGPLEVVLRKPDGSTLTVLTNSRDHQMSNEEEQAQGGVTVTYTFTLNGEFKDMDPATYEVCVSGHPECKDVTKQAGASATVEFTIDWNVFNENAETEKDCKDKYEVMGTTAITFVVCSIIDTGIYAIGQLDSAIASLLTIDINDIFDDKDVSNAYHIAWNSFRFFALGLLVIAALIMVVSQAADLDIISAYTIRKMLPRLLFAALFITLSWDIMEFLATLSNDAGIGIRTLIYAPFREMGEAGGNIAGGSIFVLTLVSTGAALGFGFIGLLSFVITGLIASLTAVVLLVLRKILIIILVMMAPFAIAAYVLPNTNQVWSLWRSTFTAVLVVFPIIMAFIATGRVFAVVAFNAPGSPTVNQLIAIFAYFLPYFLITLAFRMAGGVMATLSGALNKQTQGALGALKNFRGNRLKENMQAMGSGTRFQGRNPMARAFNATTFGATTFAKSRSKMGFLTNGAVRQAAFEQQRSLNAMQYAKTDRAEVAEENEPLLWAQTYANQASARANMAVDWDLMQRNTSGTGNYNRDADGRYYRVADGTGQYDEDTDAIEHAIGAARANGGWGRDQQLRAVRQLFDTGTGYETLQQVHRTVYRVAGNNRDLASSILGYGNSVTGKAQRLDFKQGFGEHMRLYDTMVREGDISPERIDTAILEAIRGNDAASVLKNRPEALQNILPSLSRSLARAEVRANAAVELNPDGTVLLNADGLNSQEAAKEEMGMLTGVIEQYQQAARRYAAPAIIRSVERDLSDRTAAIRDQVAEMVPTTAVVAGPTGQPVRGPNYSHDPNVARGYNQQAPRYGRRTPR